MSPDKPKSGSPLRGRQMARACQAEITFSSQIKLLLIGPTPRAGYAVKAIVPPFPTDKGCSVDSTAD